MSRIVDRTSAVLSPLAGAVMIEHPLLDIVRLANVQARPCLAVLTPDHVYAGPGLQLIR